MWLLWVYGQCIGFFVHSYHIVLVPVTYEPITGLLPFCFSLIGIYHVVLLYNFWFYEVVYPYVPGALWGSWVWPVATTLPFACVGMEDCGGSIGWDQVDEIMGRMGSWILFTNTNLIRLLPGQTLIKWFFDLMAGLGTKNSSKWGARAPVGSLIGGGIIGLISWFPWSKDSTTWPSQFGQLGQPGN